jgi:hypothetical protein
LAITGSCLCRAIRYEVDGDLLDAGHCHCSICRKQHGSAFATFASVDPSRFRWTAGGDSVSRFEASPGNDRVFCRFCGSSLAATEAGLVTSITLGTVDGDPGIRPRSHIFTDSRASWHEITDALPQFTEWPPGEGWT